MMHEVLLYGSVPAHRHKQIVNILAGVAAHQPHEVVRRHSVFTPVRKPLPKQINQGGSQGIVDEAKAARNVQGTGDVYLLQAVCEARDPRRSTDDAQEKWSIRFQDLPDAGNRAPGMTSRSYMASELDSGDALRFLCGLGYQFGFDYICEGVEFIHENLVMYLYRVVKSTLHEPPERLHGIPKPEDLMPIDSNNPYILEVKVCLDDSSDPDLMAQAISELQNIKGRFRGCLDLRQVDRLALDTRVK